MLRHGYDLCYACFEVSFRRIIISYSNDTYFFASMDSLVSPSFDAILSILSQLRPRLSITI